MKVVNIGAVMMVAISIFVFGGNKNEDGTNKLLNVAEAATAPKLTYFQVVKVVSTLGGTESMTDSQYNTVKDHGGTKLRIFVKETGYGKNPKATLGGKNLLLASKTAILNGTNSCGMDVGMECRRNDRRGIRSTRHFSRLSIQYNV